MPLCSRADWPKELRPPNRGGRIYCQIERGVGRQKPFLRCYWTAARLSPPMSGMTLQRVALPAAHHAQFLTLMGRAGRRSRCWAGEGETRRRRAPHWLLRPPLFPPSALDCSRRLSRALRLAGARERRDGARRLRAGTRRQRRGGPSLKLFFISLFPSPGAGRDEAAAVPWMP